MRCRTTTLVLANLDDDADVPRLGTPMKHRSPRQSLSPVVQVRPPPLSQRTALLAWTCPSSLWRAAPSHRGALRLESKSISTGFTTEGYSSWLRRRRLFGSKKKQHGVSWLSLQRKLGAVLHSVTCKEEVIKERAGAAALVTMSIKKNTTRGSLATTGGDFEKVSALQNELTQLMSKQRKDLAEVDHLRKQARELAVSLQWHAEVTKLLTVKLRCLGKEVQRLTTMKDAGLQCFVQTAGRHPAVVAELASLQQEKFKIKEHNAHCRAQVSCAQDHVKILLQENDRLRRMIATKVDLAQLALGELANIPKRQRIMAISRGITVGKEEVPILVGSDEASTPSDEPELQIDTGWEAEACYVQLTLATGDAQTFGDPPPQASPTSVEPKQLQVSLPNTLRTELVPTPRPRRVVDHPLASPRSARRREQVVPSPVARTPRAPRVRLGVCLSPRVGMTTLPPLPQRGPR